MERKLSKRQESMVEANGLALLVFLSIFAVPFSAICVFFMVMGLNEAREQVRLNTTAVEVPAVVIESMVARDSHGTQQSGRSIAYRPAVTFEYEIDGSAYRSGRAWAINQSSSDPGAAQRVVARHPTGAEVTAFVDPTNPNRAFLEKRWSSSPHASAVFGLAMVQLIATGYVFVIGWRWFGRFAVFAVLSSFGGLGLMGWLGWVWQTTVPAADRSDWLMPTIGAASVVCLAPVAVLFWSRKRAAEYREALEIVAEQERGS